MRDAFAARAARAGLLLRVIPLALLAVGCRPDKQGGFQAVSYRKAGELTKATNPPPPPVVPGLIAGTPARLVAKSLPAGVTQEMVDAGQKNFATTCAGCHGMSGVGTTSAPPLDDNKWINIGGQYPEIVQTITHGVPAPKEHSAPMPPKGGGNFTDEQVRELAAYVYALSHQGGA